MYPVFLLQLYKRHLFLLFFLLSKCIDTGAALFICPYIRFSHQEKHSEWSTANDNVKSTLQVNGPIECQDLNTAIMELNDTVYNYFADNFGLSETSPDDNKYKDFTVRELKKSLTKFKISKC